MDRGNTPAVQVIIGHRLKDLNLNVMIADGQYVENTGAASGSLWTTGVYGHCYEARAGVHVNAFNFHHEEFRGPECAEPYQRPPKPELPEIPDENCPVLLDLHQDGFHLSGPDPAVRFDIDADGTLDEIAWTQEGEDDAFLCWDRNHNGVIDDGRELFGYATPLVSGERAVIGYRALAELDGTELGGNRNGRVDANDRAFPELCVWADSNRDGVSQPDEIRSLDDAGVVTLEYRYLGTRLRDRFGNLFRYVSVAEMRTESGGLRLWPTYDVIFTEP